MVHSSRYGYDGHIEYHVRSTNIADLRNRLTQHLREVRAGEEIVVRDRQRPIAKIVPFTMDDEDEDDAKLVAAGLMRKGTGTLPASFWKGRRARVSVQTVVDAIRPIAASARWPSGTPARSCRCAVRSRPRLTGSVFDAN